MHAHSTQSRTLHVQKSRGALSRHGHEVQSPAQILRIEPAQGKADTVAWEHETLTLARLFALGLPMECTGTKKWLWVKTNGTILG